MLDEKSRGDLDRAIEEFKASMQVRPDDSPSHYNLGNFYMARRQLPLAIKAFERSTLLDPRSLPPLVNVSLAYSAGRRQHKKPRTRCDGALKINPDCAAANFNLGLAAW